MPQCLDCFTKSPEAHCPLCVTDPLEGGDFCGYDESKLCVDCGLCTADPEFEDPHGFVDAPTVEPFKTECGLKIYSIFTVLEALFGDEHIYPTEEADVAKFRNWLQVNNVHYYARPRESFFKYEAYNEAEVAGAEGLLMEDLS